MDKLQAGSLQKKPQSVATLNTVLILKMRGHRASTITACVESGVYMCKRHTLHHCASFSPIPPFLTVTPGIKTGSYISGHMISLHLLLSKFSLPPSHLLSYTWHNVNTSPHTTTGTTTLISSLPLPLCRPSPSPLILTLEGIWFHCTSSFQSLVSCLHSYYPIHGVLLTLLHTRLHSFHPLEYMEMNMKLLQVN